MTYRAGAKVSRRWPRASSSSSRPRRRGRSPATSEATTPSSRASATSAICRTALRTFPRRSASASARSASTSTRGSSRTTSSIPARRRSYPRSRSCSRSRTSCCSQRTRTARAKRSRGTSSRCLKPKVPVRRMVFHEITKDAITRALEETRSIDDRLVDAQETRRILDRLYGYEVSPVLWKKVTRGLSAGRVQSVATRLVVQRERERMAFRSAEYWDLLATFDPGAFECPARLARRNARSRRERTSSRRAGAAARRRRRATRRGRCTSARRTPRKVRRSPFDRSTSGRIDASLPRPFARRRSSRRRAGSSASPRRRRCASPSDSTSPDTSRT